MKTFLTLLFVFIILGAFSQKHLHKEVYYQNIFAETFNGKTEVVLEDRTRVDIVTSNYAIEVDFSTKWAESIGQALFYSLMTEKKPGVLLIMEDPEKDKKYLKRLMKVANFHCINVWTIDAELMITRY